jgi:predicted metal-dependent hydrolase
VIVDPHRSLVRTVTKYVDSVENDDVTVTVLIPELIPSKRRYEMLHNQRGRLLETALKSRTDVLVATYRYHIPED